MPPFFLFIDKIGIKCYIDIVIIIRKEGAI